MYGIQLNVSEASKVIERAAADGSSDDDHALLVAKIVAMVVLLVVTLICAALPYMLNRCLKWTSQSPEETRSSPVVRGLIYFGGGVLFATTFLHMMPDIIEIVEHLQHCGTLAKTPFALPEMLFCSGFFIIYAMDELMFKVMVRHQKKLTRSESRASEAFHRGHSIRNSVLMTEQRPNKTQVEHSESQHAAGHGHSHMPVEESGSLRGLGIILALSLHELFEGMAVGLQFTVGTVWFMFGAIAIHKLVLAFCVGMELLVARTRTSLAIIYLTTFSIVTPIGIGIGIGISSQDDGQAANLPSGILQGLAAGTLCYVVFFEILTVHHAGWRAYVAAFLGFLLMFGLQILADEAEGADNDSC
ncbi:ZIP1 [Drosophila busckii]|uniref:ZIP1 n=1 Tax=Drosophila busckii TaxID=30019 RepID=A0A0M4EDX2_DROBS|nr:zinc transporter ZIP1 [Drosophila busckii]ALC42177.1 ZIP1 [Drosophila busckii]